MHFCFIIQGFLLDSDSINIVGPHVQTYLLACELIRHGHRVSYLSITSSRKKCPCRHQDGIEVHHVPVKSLPIRLEELYLQYDLRQRLRELCPEVIYTRGRTSLPYIASQYASSSGAVAIWNAARDRDFNRGEYVRMKIAALSPLKRPLAWAAYHTTMNLLFEKGIASTNFAFVQNDYQLRHFKALFPAVPVAVLPSLYVLHDDASIDHPPRLMWVGGLKREKRPEAFLELAERFAGKDWRLEMIGPLLDRSYRERIVHAEKTNPSFIYRGSLPFDEVESRFHGATALINTSIQEGFPNTFLQAWGHGAAVFTLGVNPNGLLDGTLGFVCDSTTDLYNKLVDLQATRKFYEMGRRARAYVKKAHSPSLVIDGILSGIEKALITKKA